MSDGDLDRVQALLAVGADVNAVYDRGFTVFMTAAGCTKRSRAMLELLVAAGADAHATTELEWNAFHAAIDVDGEANEERSVREALGYLRELGVDIEQRNDWMHTPLAHAIELGTGIEVKVVCELGADPNVRAPRLVCGCVVDACASEPIVFLAINAPVDADMKLEALLKAGVDLNVVDQDGLSPTESARARLDDLTSQEDQDYGDEWIRETRRCIELLERAKASS